MTFHASHRAEALRPGAGRFITVWRAATHGLALTVALLVAFLLGTVPTGASAQQVIDPDPPFLYAPVQTGRGNVSIGFNMTEFIDAHQVCKKIGSTNPNFTYITTVYGAEWQSWRNGMPGGMSMQTCCSPARANVPLQGWQSGVDDTDGWSCGTTAGVPPYSLITDNFVATGLCQKWVINGCSSCSTDAEGNTSCTYWDCMHYKNTSKPWYCSGNQGPDTDGSWSETPCVGCDTAPVVKPMPFCEQNPTAAECVAKKVLPTCADAPDLCNTLPPTDDKAVHVWVDRRDMAVIAPAIAGPINNAMENYGRNGGYNGTRGIEGTPSDSNYIPGAPSAPLWPVPWEARKCTLRNFDQYNEWRQNNGIQPKSLADAVADLDYAVKHMFLITGWTGGPVVPHLTVQHSTSLVRPPGYSVSAYIDPNNVGNCNLSKLSLPALRAEDVYKPGDESSAEYQSQYGYAGNVGCATNTGNYFTSMTWWNESAYIESVIKPMTAAGYDFPLYGGATQGYQMTAWNICVDASKLGQGPILGDIGNVGNTCPAGQVPLPWLGREHSGDDFEADPPPTRDLVSVYKNKICLDDQSAECQVKKAAIDQAYVERDVKARIMFYECPASSRFD